LVRSGQEQNKCFAIGLVEEIGEKNYIYHWTMVAERAGTMFSIGREGRNFSIGRAERKFLIGQPWPGDK
jgi:hypothetical protein